LSNFYTFFYDLEKYCSQLHARGKGEEETGEEGKGKNAKGRDDSDRYGSHEFQKMLWVASGVRI
jgi:hypothetical protein